MPHSLSSASLHKDTHKHKQTTSNKHGSQHGRPDPAQFRLLELPAESLTHITSFLDPISLLALGRTNQRLHEHIEDENTWRRAYVNQFLGISPEGDIYESSSPTGSPGKALMLRREEVTWKREFVRRWNLKRRWENIRPSTISHTPVHSAVAEMHLMPSASPDPALLTASLRYGIVARSLPLKGKTLRGFLDASGTLNGIGHGNPNAEFSPDVSRCVMSADGGTARVLWGFRTGAVAVTTAPKAMDAARAVGARWLRCAINDAHEGAVEDAAWGVEPGNAPRFFVTGGADGRAKIWDAKRVSCVWTSQLKPGQLLRDPIVKIAVDIAAGVVAAALKSGESVVWTGFSTFFDESTKSIDDSSIKEIRVPAPKSSVSSGPYADAHATMTITAFHLFCESPSQISLLASYNGEPRLTRSAVSLPTGSVEQTVFGDDATGAVTATCPVFASKPGDHSFVLAGDQLGSVSVFPWNGIPTLSTSPQPIRSVPAIRKFQAHDGGAVTALVWTPTAIITGSSVGTLRAFDSLTLLSMRGFTYPTVRNNVEDHVKGIVVERDFFAASIGDRIVAWRGEPQGKTHKVPKGKGTSRSSNAIAKWHQQVEISREIKESRRELEYEHEHVQQGYGRAREQNHTLEHLGLTEVEAVEYVLMLSRDEEERRRLEQNRDEFEVFGGDFDEDVQTPITSPPSFLDTASSSTNRYGFPNRAQFAPSSSMAKIQISPRVRPEPTEAGFSCSPLSRSVSGSLSSSISSSRGLSRTSSQAPSRGDPTQFPAMAATPTRRSISGSPASARSAWSTPLRAAHSEGPSSPRASASVAGSPAAPRAPGVSLLSEKFAEAMAVREEDEDLRYALELSLAEARSRGEGV
ncbi:F-box protein [Phanerochaete sordida]|uniref:F-box protein n=1 Tax=Phanerochaete sordida TaxID=48140 RepID=A0A9P3GC27_9APHY|nr:F-box protein [Phanerochaete sordida]